MRRPRRNYAREWRSWRLKQGLTQDHLAVAMSMSRRGVQYIEAGEKIPYPATRHRFRELQKKYERAQCQTTP